MDGPSTEMVVAAACDELVPLLRDTAALLDRLVGAVAGGSGDVLLLERLTADAAYNLAVVADLAGDVAVLGSESQRCTARLALRAVSTQRWLLEAVSGLVGKVAPARCVVKAS